MPKPTKGLYLDIRPQEQPEGTYPFGKNGIQHDLVGSVFNEPGFKLMASAAPYQLNGIIETDDKPVLFSTNNTNSAIGFFNPQTELYEPILNDGNGTWALGSARLGFSVNYYITGQAQRNYKGELVIAFTDKDKYPKYLNCDNPSLSNIDNLRLFPFFKPPTITAIPVTGGRIDAGTYYVAVGYERNDGTSTPYSAVSKFVTVALVNGQQGLTDKAIEITIASADQSFDNLRIAIISRIAGKTTAVELSEFLPITGSSLTFTYTGDNITTDIDVSSILVQPAVYNRVGTIGQLNDALYIADLQAEPDIDDMQSYAGIVQLEWVSELIDAVNPPAEHVNGTKKGWMHEEVGAFYIRYNKVRGGTTKWFTIPGNTPVSGDLTNSSEAISGGGSSVPRYKVDDTISHFDAVTRTGATGIWKNSTELYPNTIDFDSTSLGGTNHRNQPVLHHKMPSIRWCKKNLYNTDARYGKTHLDILGIRVLNVRIPDKYIGVIDGYELGYAKRTVGNMTVYGQSILLHGAIHDDITPVYTSGGNWNTDTRKHDGDLTIRKDTFRFHAFDMLFNKPSIEPTFISSQLKLRTNTIGYEDGLASDNEGGGARPIILLADYVDGTTPSSIVPGKYLRQVDKSFYLTVDINANNFINLKHENCFAGILLGSNWDLNVGKSGFDERDNHTTPEVDYNPGFEETYLINQIAVKSDIYSNLFSQSLVSAGNVKALTDTTPFFGGDVFISDYTFHTYGRHDTFDTKGDGYLGIKVVRRFVCESVSNINLRYEITGNQYSQWYPNNGLIANKPNQTYISLFDRSKDPNQFGYSKDFNALNDLVSSVIYNPFREELTVFPYRIHRGGKQNRQSRPRSWRTFLPLDYYEMQKNMGRLIHLEGMEDRLLIHCENALFLTQDKATLDSSQLSVTLGSGDIFQFEPQPAEDSKLGIGGTQHDLACVNTPVGYIFPDAKQGEIYLFKGKLQNLGVGISTFIREYLKITNRNNFTGDGITIGWDQKYKRVLLTVKHRELVSGGTIKSYENTTTFWTGLTVGDIINYFGRLIKYKGVNDSIYNCDAVVIPDVITWQKTGPSCVTVGGHNTGMRQWSTRIRLTNGVADGYSEANTPNAGIGTYFPPIYDTTACTLPSATVTWVGSQAYCEADSADCPDGYTLSDDKYTCSNGDSITDSTNRVNTSILVYAQRCRYINGVPDGYCEDNTAGANYVAPVTDNTTCPVPVTGLQCGAIVTESFNGSGAHTYDIQTINIFNSTVTLAWECYDRPNRFTIKDNGSQLLTTGWKGYAGYSGPWGTILSQTSESGILSYTPVVGHVYTVVVETGPSDPDNDASDSYSYSITCSPL